MIKRIAKKFSESARLTRALGDGTLARAKLFSVALLLPVAGRFFIPLRRGFLVRLRSQGESFEWRLADTMDLVVLREVFLDQEYRIKLAEEPNVIFDLGSNIGASVLYFRLTYPSAKIYAFEPDPHNFRRLAANVGHFKNVFLFPYALSDADEQKTLFLHPDSHLGSSLFRRKGNARAEIVKSRTLDSIMQELAIPRVDLLKFDIEGAEYDAFKSFAGLSRVGALVGEVHFDLMPAAQGEFERLFADFSVNARPTLPQRFLLSAIQHTRAH